MRVCYIQRRHSATLAKAYTDKANVLLEMIEREGKQMLEKNAQCG